MKYFQIIPPIQPVVLQDVPKDTLMSYFDEVSFMKSLIMGEIIIAVFVSIVVGILLLYNLRPRHEEHE